MCVSRDSWQAEGKWILDCGTGVITEFYFSLDERDGVNMSLQKVIPRQHVRLRFITSVRSGKDEVSKSRRSILYGNRFQQSTGSGINDRNTAAPPIGNVDKSALRVD